MSTRLKQNSSEMAYDNCVNIKLIYCHNTEQRNAKYIQSNWLFKITFVEQSVIKL